MRPNPTWATAQKILCIRLDGMGDLLMTTPAIRAAKQGIFAQEQTGSNLSEREITLLTSPAAAEVATLIPEVDHLLIYDAPWMKATAPRANSQPELEMITGLQQAGFDAAIIFTVFSQNPLPAALTCFLANIPLRLAHCHENPYQLLTDWQMDPEPNQGIRHEVQRQLDLVASVGYQTTNQRLSLQVRESDRQQLQVHLTRHGVDLSQPWIVVHPGATAPSRRYPAAHFAEVIRQLVLNLNIQVMLTGTAIEQPLVQSIQQQSNVPSISLVGQLTLGELAALIAESQLLISNNTGPAHLAAALGTPVIDLYALTNPQHTPWQVPQRVLFADVPCKYCYKSICPAGHHDCLTQVSPTQVYQAALELLASTSSYSGLNSAVERSTPPLTTSQPRYAQPQPTQVFTSALEAKR